MDSLLPLKNDVLPKIGVFQVFFSHWCFLMQVEQVREFELGEKEDFDKEKELYRKEQLARGEEILRGCARVSPLIDSRVSHHWFPDMRIAMKIVREN